MPEPCPAAEVVAEGPRGPSAVCRVESTSDGARGGSKPVSIVRKETSPVSFARCSGTRREPTMDELIAGTVSLDSDGLVVDSECHKYCPSWRLASEHTGAGRWMDDERAQVALRSQA